MAQTARKIVSQETQDVATQDTATLNLFNAWTDGLEAYRVQVEVIGIASASAKDAKAEGDRIERIALWAAFDYARRASNDPAEMLAKMVGEFVEVKAPENGNLRRQYLMRARDCFNSEFAEAFKNADREKASPLTVAKKARADAVKSGQQTSLIAKATPIAEAIAAEAMGTTPEGVHNLIESGDMNAALKFSAAMEAAKDALTVRDDLIAVLWRLRAADSKTQHECTKLIAWAYAV